MSIRYAWPVLAEPPTCRLGNLRIDGEPAPETLVDDDHLRVDLSGLADWSRLECEVVVETAGPAPDGITDLLGYVVVACGPTNARLPWELEGAPLTGWIEVSRSDVAERFSIETEIAAFVGGRRKVVGTSAPWTFVIDARAAPAPPGKPPFSTVWVDFAAADAPMVARQNPEAHAVMDLDNEPRLLLNSAIDGFQNILHADAAKLERRRLRDLLGANVARYALSSLFRAAAVEVVALEGGGVQPPDRALYRQVCEAVADRMTGIGSVEELYERLVDARESTVATVDLWGRVDVAIDALTSVSSTIATVCEEVRYV